MKKFVLYLFLLAGTQFIAADSFAKKIVPPPDTTIISKPDYEYRSNIDQLVRYQDEQRAKQKRAAMIRIGIGVGFLIVLVIGLRRKRKG